MSESPVDMCSTLRPRPRARIGGNRLAFEKVGGKCVFSSEIDPSARLVYLENFGETPAGARALVPQGEGRNPRRLTPRECARLIGFPENFKLPVSDIEAYRLISGSVVVPLVGNIAKKIAVTLQLVDIPLKSDPIVTTSTEPGWRSLEKRVAAWLKRQDYEVKSPDLVPGHMDPRPHQVDVHAWKEGIFSRVDVWVECKRLKTSVKRSDVSKLIQSAREVKAGGSWTPRLLMLVAEGDFDISAERLAEKYGVYLVKAGLQRFQFVGKMTREDFKYKKASNY